MEPLVPKFLMLLAAVLEHVVRAGKESIAMWTFMAVLVWMVVRGGVLVVGVWIHLAEVCVRWLG